MVATIKAQTIAPYRTMLDVLLSWLNAYQGVWAELHDRRRATNPQRWRSCNQAKLLLTPTEVKQWQAELNIWYHRVCGEVGTAKPWSHATRGAAPAAGIWLMLQYFSLSYFFMGPSAVQDLAVKSVLRGPSIYPNKAIQSLYIIWIHKVIWWSPYMAERRSDMQPL